MKRVPIQRRDDLNLFAAYFGWLNQASLGTMDRAGLFRQSNCKPVEIYSTQYGHLRDIPSSLGSVRIA